MEKKLILAEKNSMARDIVKAIGNMSYNKSDDYYEGQEYVVVALAGHVLQYYDMEDYDNNLKKWNIENLPFIPQDWKLREKSDTYPKKKYKIAKKLIIRKDITEIINAGDPDIEGEVLVNEVIYKVFAENNIKKKVRRLWIIDHVESTIRNELQNAKDIKNTENLYLEGIARGKLDWLYGINLTRYITCRTGSMMSAGRVIVPTVKYVYDRDMEIKNFKPKMYKDIISQIEKDGKNIKLNFKELRFFENEYDKIADVLEDIRKYKIKVVDVKKTKQIKEPKKLFKLSTLQIHCSNKYKFSPTKTLQIVQSLYEKGYLTYPRTNSEYMTEQEKVKAQKIIEALKNSGIKEIKFKDTKKIFDDSKIDSHSAITPTEKIANRNQLSEDENIIYDTVKNRFLSNFCKEKCIVNAEKIIFQLDKYKTNLSGTEIISKGYLMFENDLSENILPEFTIGEEFGVKYEIIENQTKAPAKVTQAELIKFYNKPFKNGQIEDDEEIDDKEEYENIKKGIEIGTEATRASTISKVIKIGYILESKGKLSITDLGINFIETLQKLNINLWKEKTVELSQMLKNVSNGVMSVENALKFAKDELNLIIDNGKNIEIKKMQIESKVIGKCPLCSNNILESQKSYYCSNFKNGCNFNIWKQISGKKINKAIVDELLKNKESKMINDFTSKTGKKFSAKLKIQEDGKIGFVF